MLRDLTGLKFNKWTVLGPGERNEKGRYRWKCQCECGRIGNVYASSLISGGSKSCGYCTTRGGNPTDITGLKFGRLTALYRIDDDRKDTYWLCRCDCGNTIEVPLGSLWSGNTRSCGCLHRDFMDTIDRTKISHKKHGAFDRYGHGERLYSIWKGMRGRCNDKNRDCYKYYGGRGIKVCEEWDKDYAIFRDWALAHGYDKDAKRGDCTIDRINNDGNYEPDNCRFVSMKIQNSNKRKQGSCE